MADMTTTQQHVRLGSNAGQPMTRRDGLLKVTGRAPYAADLRPEGVLHAVTAVAGIARGTVTHLNTDAAMAHPGVVRVYTPANRPRWRSSTPRSTALPGRPRRCRTTRSAMPASPSRWSSPRRWRPRPRACAC